MFDKERTGYKESAVILILALFLIGISSTAAAKSGDLITGFDSPVENANISGSFGVTVNTNSSTVVSYVEFYHNRSDSENWSMMDNVSADDPDQTSFSTSNSTDYFEDGLISLNATAHNDTHVDSSNILVVLDETAPNATDNLSVQEDFTNSYVAENLIDSNSVTLNWSEADSEELVDATSGVEKYDVEYRRRAYNPPTQTFESWTDWSDRKSDLDKTLNSTGISELEDSYQYQFRLQVIDWAGHSNLSNTVNVTIDTSPPQFDTQDNERISTPYKYTNNEDQYISANITDIVGIILSKGDRGIPDKINLSIYNGSGRIAAPPINITPDSGDAVELKIETFEALENLNHSEAYTVSIAASDRFDQWTTGLNWTFNADFEGPEDVSVSASGDESSGWYKDDVTFEVTCSDDVSGVDQVAVGSSEWKDEGSEFSFDDNGENSYTFKCKDNVGNINNSLSESYKVDTGTPSFDYADPEDDEENVPISFEFFASFNDESDESGIDTDGSSLTLDGGDGDLDDIDWDNDSVTAQVDNLEVDESYSIEGEIVDNVGHSDSFTVDFDTASLTSSDLQISSLPDTTTLYRNGSTDISFDVENDGEIEQTGIELNFTVDEINSSLDYDSGFDLGADESESITVDLSADKDIETDVYEATVEAESGEGVSNSATTDIRVVDEGVVLNLEDHPSDVDIEQGGLVSETFEISNTGEDTAEDVSFSLPVENISLELDPETASINSLSTQEVIATFSASNSTDIRVQNTNFTAEGSNTSVEGEVSVKIQPSSNETKQDIETNQQEISTQVDEMDEEMNKTKTANIRGLMSQAKAALDQDDYATAAEIHQQVEEELNREGGLLSSLPLFPIVVVAVILILAFIGFLIMLESESGRVRSRGSGGSGKSTSPSSSLGSVRPSKNEGYSYEDKSLAGKITDKIGVIGSSISGVFSRSGGSDEVGSRELDDMAPTSRSGKERRSSGKDEEFEYNFKERNR